MSQSSDSNPQLAISAPAVIVICIIGAVLVLVIAAATSRLFRRDRTLVDEEIDNAVWNPNRRVAEQVERMQEVRWINNMNAWERAKIARAEIGEGLHGSYHRGWLMQAEQNQGVQDSYWSVDTSEEGVGSGQRSYDTTEISTEEFLASDQLHGNPYREMLQARLEHADRGVEIRPSLRIEDLVRRSMQATVHDSAAVDTKELRREAVKITVQNVDEDFSEIPLDQTPTVDSNSHLPRSSSAYSGDALLPMSHLNLMQSARSAARQSAQSLKVHPMIEHWEG